MITQSIILEGDEMTPQKYILLFIAVSSIAVWDWIIFRKWCSCPKCGIIYNEWYNFLLPTLLEILLFLSGITIGSGLK